MALLLSPCSRSRTQSVGSFTPTVDVDSWTPPSERYQVEPLAEGTYEGRQGRPGVRRRARHTECTILVLHDDGPPGPHPEEVSETESSPSTPETHGGIDAHPTVVTR